MPRPKNLMAPFADGRAVRAADVKAAPMGDLLDALEEVAVEYSRRTLVPNYLQLSRRRLRDAIQRRAAE